MAGQETVAWPIKLPGWSIFTLSTDCVCPGISQPDWWRIFGSAGWPINRRGPFPIPPDQIGRRSGKIREGNRCSAAGHREAMRLIGSSTIKGEQLYLETVRTQRWVQQAIEVACLKAGGISAMTIVAGGDQACDPHCRGSGPLRANELIVVDIFPRMSSHGFWRYDPYLPERTRLGCPTTIGQNGPVGAKTRLFTNPGRDQWQNHSPEHNEIFHSRRIRNG